MKPPAQTFGTVAAQADRDWAAGRWRQAVEGYQRAAQLAPDDPRPRFNVAGTLQVLGRLDEAASTYRALLDTPMRMAALAQLAKLTPAALTAEDEAEMAREARQPDAESNGRAELCFALGSLVEDRDRFDDAFQWFAEGNALKRAALGDAATTAPQRHANDVRALKTVFTADLLAQCEGRGHHLAAPIFVVGMPRSGSTLVEQILSSHRKVQGLGERPVLATIIAGRYPLNPLAPEAPDHFRRLAQAYLAAMHQYGWKNSPRFVDKMLGNYANIGMIHLMFPRATVLHVTRDPADLCLANFRTLFGSANEESYDLGDIGRAYRRYREVMDHWEKVLPGRVVDVSYEALVNQPDQQIRWLVTEACGLEWDDACLGFHDARLPVRTASVATVRQPIFNTSTQRWRRYAKHLDPLFEALGSVDTYFSHSMMAASVTTAR